MINESITSARHAANLGLALALLAGCSGGKDSAGGNGIVVRPLVSAQYCEPAEPGVLHVREREALRKLTGDTALDSDADFTREMVVLVVLGARPSAGFELQLVADTASVVDSVATLRLRERKPAPDEVAAQALTSPCLGVALQPGPYTTVQALLEDGTRLGIVALRPGGPP